MEESWICEVLW